MNRQQWLELRRDGIGGSDIATIVLGEQYGKTAEDLWMEKRGLWTPPPPDPDILDRGHVMEPIILGKFRKQYPDLAVHAPRNDKDRFSVYMRWHPRIEWVYADLDAYVGRTIRRPDAVVEIKSMMSPEFRKLADEGVGANKQLQVQWQMFVTGCKLGYLAIMCPDTWKMMVLEIERDDDLIELMLGKAATFWEYVRRGEKPDGLVVKPIDYEIPSKGGLAEADEMFVRLARGYREMHQIEADAKVGKAYLAGLLQRRFEKQGLDAVCGSGLKVTYHYGKGSSRFNKKALAADGIDPEKYMQQGAPARTLRVSGRYKEETDGK